MNVRKVLGYFFLVLPVILWFIGCTYFCMWEIAVASMLATGGILLCAYIAYRLLYD